MRDLDRKAALMHFSSEQAAELSERRSWVSMSGQRTNPRVAHVRSLAKPPSCGSFRLHFIYIIIFSLLSCINSWVFCLATHKLQQTYDELINLQNIVVFV